MPPDLAPNPFWRLVDAVLVINLDQRADRWANLQHESSGLIPADRLHRSPAVLGRELTGFGKLPWFRGRSRDATWAARAGCTLAHRRALATAREKNWHHALILEDDIVLPPALVKILPTLGTWLETNPEAWDICYLGYTDPMQPSRHLIDLPAGTSLHAIYGCNCAHAYLVNGRTRDDLLARLPTSDSIWPWLARHRAIDRWYMRTLGRRHRVVAVSPCLINQRAGFSDIVRRETDYQLTGTHRLAIPDNRLTSCSFDLLSSARSLQTRLTGGYDVLRGLGKRLRGF